MSKILSTTLAAAFVIGMLATTADAKGGGSPKSTHSVSHISKQTNNSRHHKHYNKYYGFASYAYAPVCFWSYKYERTICPE